MAFSEQRLGGLSASPTRVRIISGSATDSKNLEYFSKTCQPAGMSITFSATVAPDGPSLASIVSVSKKLRRKLIVLQESDTTYGNDAGIGARAATVLPFPAHVSRIRSEHARSQGQATGSTGISIPKRLLDPSLIEERVPAELVPMYDSQTLVSEDIVLGELLGSIGKCEGTGKDPIVGVLATSTNDALFLARAVRRYAPDVTFAFFTSDALFVHPEFRNDVLGSVVYSTYPLSPAVQDWTVSGMGSLRLFASESAQGVYNAVLFQFNETKQLVDYANPLGDASGGRDADPGANGPTRDPLFRPPRWVSIVGRDGMWPYALVESQDAVLDRQYLHGAPAPPGSSRRPQVPVGVLDLLFWLVAAFLVGGCLVAQFLGSRLARPFGDVVVARGERDPVRIASGAALFWVMGLGIAASVVILAPLWRHASLSPTWLAMVIAFTAGLALLCSVTGLAHVLWTAMPKRASRSTGWLAAAIWCVAFVACAGLPLASWWPDGDADGAAKSFFVAYRALFPSNGLSPLVPIGLLCGAACVFALRIMERAQMRDALAAAAPRARALPLVCAITIVLLAYAPVLPRFSSFPFRDRFFLPVAVPVVAALSAYSFVNFYLTWRRIRGVTVRLAFEPSFAQLGPVASAFAWNPIGELVMCSRRPELAARRVAELRTTAGTAWHDPALGVLSRVPAAGAVTEPVRLGRSAGNGEAQSSGPEIEPTGDGLPLFLSERLRLGFGHLRSYLHSAVSTAVLLLLALTTYPFHPRRAILAFCWWLLLAGALATLVVFIEIRRDIVLCRLTDSRPAKFLLSWDVIRGLVFFGVVPVLALVAAQFPDFGNALVSWLDPVLRAFR